MKLREAGMGDGLDQGRGGASPQLAKDICARRLGALGLAEEGVAGRCGITWPGPAGYRPDRPWTEASVQALSGLMEVHGRDAGTPRRIGLEVASVAAGILAAQGTIAGAIARHRGRTVTLETSVVQAALVLLTHYFVVATGLGDAVPGPPLPAPGPPFRSADHQWFEIESLDAEPWQAFWRGLGVADVDLARAWTMFRWRYERAACSLPVGLHEAANRHSIAQLSEVAAASAMSLTPLRDYAAAVVEPGIGAAHPDIRMLDGPARSTSPAPDGALLPLAGIQVVEATSRIQGPFAGMLLRMLGADVRRIQPPEGDYGRAALSLHRGKEATQLDLSRRAGRAELVDFVAGADVFLHNWRPGKSAEWDLRFEDLVARRPGLVYASSSGWGDRPQAENLIGTDFLVQAYTGMGDGIHPLGTHPVPSRMVLCDLFGGLVAAEGILAGLLQRELTGRACEVRSSLLAGAMSTQSHVLAGRGRPLWDALDRPVPTTDGAVMISVDDAGAFDRLCRACGIFPDSQDEARTRRVMADRISEGTAADWEERLTGDGIGGIAAAVVCADLATVPADARLAHLFEPVDIGGVAPRLPWTIQ